MNPNLLESRVHISAQSEIVPPAQQVTQSSHSPSPLAFSTFQYVGFQQLSAGMRCWNLVTRTVKSLTLPLNPLEVHWPQYKDLQVNPDLSWESSSRTLWQLFSAVFRPLFPTCTGSKLDSIWLKLKEVHWLTYANVLHRDSFCLVLFTPIILFIL